MHCYSHTLHVTLRTGLGSAEAGDVYRPRLTLRRKRTICPDRRFPQVKYAQTHGGSIARRAISLQWQLPQPNTEKQSCTTLFADLGSTPRYWAPKKMYAKQYRTECAAVNARYSILVQIAWKVDSMYTSSQKSKPKVQGPTARGVVRDVAPRGIPVPRRIIKGSRYNM